MSYILDALRRSDAEREREQAQVPGLFAQPSADAVLRTADSPRRGVPGWALIIAGVALGVALPSIWFVLTRPAPSAPPMPLAPPPPPPVVQREPAAMAPSVPDVPVAPPATPKVQASPSVAPAAAPAPAPARPPQEALAPRAAKPVAVAPKAASAAATMPAERAPKLSELPESVRREIPNLTFGGAVYSETPSARFVILNGLIYREQDRVAPDLVVEQIKLKSAVLRWRDQRFEMAF